MMMKLSFPVATLAVMAICFAACPDALATNIDFSCSDGSGTGQIMPFPVGVTPPSTPLCNGTSPAYFGLSRLNSWTQDGYLVLPTTTNWTFDPTRGDPKPDLTEVYNTGTIVTTDGGGTFNFNSFRVEGPNLKSYTVTGILSGKTVFQFSCKSNCSSAGFETILDPFANKLIDDLSITINAGGPPAVVYLDNIVVSPEPNGLLLLGSGMLALAFFIRRSILA